MLKQYFRNIYLSFYSPSAYTNALNNWQGRGLKYLLLVTVLTSSLISLRFSMEINKFDATHLADTITGVVISESDLTFEENLNRFINILHQIPKLHIKNEKIITPEAKPYHITDPVSGYEIAVIDTTGQYKSLKETDATILLTETSMFFLHEKNNKEDSTEDTIYLKNFKEQYSLDDANINEALFLIGQIPAFSLHNGKFVTEDNKTFEIVNKAKVLLAQIGPDAALSEKGLEPMLAINEDEIAYKTFFNKRGDLIKASDLNEQTFFEMIKSGVTHIKNFFIWKAPIIALPLIVLASFMLSLLTLLLYSFICLSLIKTTNAGTFSYTQIMRISAVAITPMLIISAVMPNIIPSQGIIYFLISVGYIYFAVKSVTNKP